MTQQNIPHQHPQTDSSVQDPQQILKAKNRMTLLALVVLIVVLFIVTLIKIKTQTL